MINVNNKKCIKNIAKKIFILNKTRNVFVVIAIILTCILFTASFTISDSLRMSIEETTMRQVGGNSHGVFKYITQEEYDILSSHKDIKGISKSIILGVGENPELKKRVTELRYISDKSGAKSFFAMPTTGRLPQNNDEVAMDTLVLKRLGITARIGEQVTLEYSIKDEKVRDNFTLVGFWEGDLVNKASIVWLNKGYVDKQLGDVEIYEKGLIGTIQANFYLDNSVNIDRKVEKIIADSELSDIDYGVNWAYTGSVGVDPITAIAVIFVIFLIIFCGYLMISNIFYISITADIRNFGLLKMIGTTRVQIKKIIYYQAIYLYIIGIPLGLIFGFGIGKFLTPFISSIMNTDIIKISQNPMIFIFSIIFTFITVLMSIAKPAKIASKVSPIEALKNVDISASTKKCRKIKKINIKKIAFFNVIRNKKKVIMVTISLSLSLIILNIAFSMANGYDGDKYVSNNIINDFAIGDVSNFNVFINYKNQDTLDDEFLGKLEQQKGIKNLNKIYFAELPTKIDNYLREILIKENLDDNGTVTPHIYGLSDNIFNELNIVQGEIDIDKLKTGKYIIASSAYKTLPYYNLGDKVSFIPSIDGGETDRVLNIKEYEVMAVAEIPYPISIKHSHFISPNFFIPEDIFLQDIAKKTPMLVTLDVEKKVIPQITDFLASYIDNVDIDLEFNFRAKIVAEYENMKTIYRLVGLALSSILSIIGIMNFVNTSITSIIARKREIAILQSIGMTGKQVNKMLIIEGIYYTIFTAIFTFSIGSIIGKIVILGFAKSASYQSEYFSIIPSILCIPILVIIILIVPIFIYKRISKQTIVERLRICE